MSNDLLAELLALAAALENDGQYNNAKILRASADALLTRFAHRAERPSDKAELQARLRRAASELEHMNVGEELVDANRLGMLALAEGRLALYHETPDAFVCRICGQTAVRQAPETCPNCGAPGPTFKRHRAVYWLDAFEPAEIVQHLRATPARVRSMVEGGSEAALALSPADGGWSLRDAVAHLRDAQSVFEYRVALHLDRDNPVLESAAVFEWSHDEAHKTTQDIFEEYASSRARTLARLEPLAPAEWQRPGRHTEFGDLVLRQTASYFTCHELTHLPQLRALV